ncbi:MAG: triose-phosphate isomerase [Desulfosalsimonadaceae bacterium]
MESRRPLIAGNWKMHKTCPEAVNTARALAGITTDVEGADIMIAPPFPALAPVAEALAGSQIGLGAQNLYWEQQGAYTGEVSADMIVSAGCSYVIIGHSERRHIFGETDEAVNKKTRAALGAKLTPVLCVGETESERDEGKTFSTLDKQIEKGLEGLNLDIASPPIIAYEPVWAIGTGRTATADQAEEAHAHIRQLLAQQCGREMAEAVRILYGGSVKPKNIAELMAREDIDGALAGGASLDADTFSRLIHY